MCMDVSASKLVEGERYRARATPGPMLLPKDLAERDIIAQIHLARINTDYAHD